MHSLYRHKIVRLHPRRSFDLRDRKGALNLECTMLLECLQESSWFSGRARRRKKARTLPSSSAPRRRTFCIPEAVSKSRSRYGRNDATLAAHVRLGACSPGRMLRVQTAISSLPRCAYRWALVDEPCLTCRPERRCARFARDSVGNSLMMSERRERLI